MKSFLTIVLVSILSGVCVAQTTQPAAANDETRVIAVALDKEITLAEKDKLVGLILGTLLDQYAKEHQITPTEEELDQFVESHLKNKRRMYEQALRDRERLKEELQSATLTEKERQDKQKHLENVEFIVKHEERSKQDTSMRPEEKQAIIRGIGKQFVTDWKVRLALYKQYGGRVSFQQVGPEPLDAYLAFLRKKHAAEDFHILDQNYWHDFWEYFTDDQRHWFFSKEEGEKAIKTPWWQMSPDEN